MNTAKWIFCVMLFLMISLGMLYAQIATGTNRPATVPSDYVITPFGYFHPSCVREVKAGETLLGDGRIRFEDGTEETNAASCSFSRYGPTGQLAGKDPGNSGPLSISWNWIETSQVATNDYYGGVSAAWTVPLTPNTNDGQTLYFFNSLSHLNNDPPHEEPIIQPVLGWNDGQYGVGLWNIASWNCCPNGMTWHSTPLSVNPGDQILGTVLSSCGFVACGRWTIITTDATTAQSTTLHVIYSTPLTFVWAQAGVLEVYNIYQCSDFPPDGSITFSNVILYDKTFRQITHPGWSPKYWVQQGVTTPWCDYAVTATDTTATLYYQPKN